MSPKKKRSKSKREASDEESDEEEEESEQNMVKKKKVAVEVAETSVKESEKSWDDDFKKYDEQYWFNNIFNTKMKKHLLPVAKVTKQSVLPFLAKTTSA